MSYLNTNLKIFKFDDGEDYWIAAENKEDAIECFETGCNDTVELEEGYEVEEVSKDDDTCINCREDEDLLKIMNRYKVFNRSNEDEAEENVYIPLWLYLKCLIIESELQGREFETPSVIASSVC